ncbi:hypothetical protein ABFA07_011646 [Porites harrisoni]
MDSEDDVRLTSFRPLSPDTSQSSFSLARLFQRKRPEARVEVKIDSTKKHRPVSPLVSPRSSPQLQKRVSTTKNPELPRSWSASPLIGRRRTSAPGSVGIGSRRNSPGYRNVHAVLGRLNAAADGRGQLRQEYKKSDFKQYWMPDENCKECYECGEKFNTFRRRHHCRLCGQIFCYRCCYLEIPGKIMGYSGFLRVCTYCHKVVQRYTQSADLMVRNLEQLQADLSAFTSDTDITTNNSGNMNLANPRSYPFDFDDEENFYVQPSHRKLSNSPSMTALSSYGEKERPLPMPGRRPFDAFGVCAAEADMLKQDSFRELWNQMISPKSGLELQSHRFRLRTYQNCLVGSELVDWLLTYEKTSTRNQAVTIGQGLLDSGWLEPVPNTREGRAVFKDEYILYQPGVTAREVATPKRSFWGDADKSSDKSGSWNESYEKNDHVDDDNDETVPHWFRQLDHHEIEPMTDDLEASNTQEVSGKLSNHKTTAPKLLDLDLMNGVATEEGDSELLLKVDLQHFGEPGKPGVSAADANGEAASSTLSLITDVPPPPLEQYVYNEGYPHTPLRPSTKKTNEGGPSVAIISTSNTPDEIFSGAMMARKIGVDRSSSGPDLEELREDNGEKLAMERLWAAHSYHLNTLLEQLLKDAALSVDWKDTILPLVKRISAQVTPDVHKDDDMDIREYVKFKKIPGGSKSDCEMISGVVFTKNIANKKMSSVLHHPRILVLSCAIDYQRNENRLACLDALIRQEYEFLKNFVARVVSLKPNILLVEKTVSRLAQDMLLKHGVTLVLNVKRRVIERIARCTRADVLYSMEQLSRPQLGTCQSFKVQSYTLKNGESKTLMFLDGCPADLSCTVNLRGGNSFVLSKVKRIFQHMVYVAYSLRLELHFLMDEFGLPPDAKTLIEEREIAARNFAKRIKFNDRDSNGTEGTAGEKNKTDILQQDSSEGSEVFLSALKSTVLSSSPFLDYPLPYLLTEAGRNFALRSTLPPDIYWSARMDVEHNSSHLTEEDLEKFEFSNPNQRRLSKLVCMVEPHPIISASLTMDRGDPLFQALLADFRAQGGQIQLERNSETVSRARCRWLDGVVKKAENQTKGDRRDAQENYHAERDVAKMTNKAVEEKQNQSAPTSPLHLNRKQVDCLDPYVHQRIAVLFISYSNESNNSPRPCISPWAVFMEFYGRNDITLGGFLEIYCFRPSYICPNPNCDIPMVDHVRYFAHGTGSVYIHMRNLESPIPGFQHTILTWSWCKECKQVTPIVPLSPEAWAFSFAKYLELRFYAGSYKRRASVEPCGHSLHKDHYQYFAYANMVASFKYRPIKLFEIAIPPPMISVKDMTRDASFWINDLRAMATRGETVFAAFYDRLESLKDFSIQPDHQARMKQFYVALRDEHSRFLEQCEIVEKKANSLQTPQNPLAMENENSCEPLGPDDRQALEYVIANSLNSLKKTLCEVVEGWNNSLQEYVQAEKKKNSKASSTREGKLLSSSSLQLEGKSTESLNQQLNKSADMVLGVGMNSTENRSPSLTPWGSRSASPYSTPDTNEPAGEAFSNSDMEVLQVTSSFRPITHVAMNVATPSDSPTQGILPVGGVVSGHSLPGLKSEHFARIKLQKNAGGSYKAFVVSGPCGEEVPFVTEKDKECSGVTVDGEKEPYGAGVDIAVVTTGAKESDAQGPPEVKMDGSKDPPEVKMDGAKDPPGVNMDCANEPPGVKMDSEKDPPGVKMDDEKEPPGLRLDDAKEATDRDIMKKKEEERSSWYVIEGEDQDSSILDDVRDTKGQQSVSQDHFCPSAETKLKEAAVKSKEDAPTVVKANAFSLGHRRVVSSPSMIAVSPAESNLLCVVSDVSGGAHLQRSRSDSELNAHVKQRETQMLMETTFESVGEGSVDLTRQKETVSDADELDGGSNEEPELRKAKTLPSLFSKTVSRSQSWAVNQWQTTVKKVLTDAESDVFADGSTNVSKRAKLKRMVPSFMSSPAFQPVASTFPSHEHHLLPPGEKVLVVVSEKETSSIIAYTLSTTEYNERLHQIQRTLSDIKNEATRELQMTKNEFGKSVEVSVNGRTQQDAPSDKFVRVNSNPESGEDYVHLDIVDPETAHEAGNDGETINVKSSDNLEFMNNSVEIKLEPDHYSKVDRVRFSKVKHAAGKDDTKKTENSLTQESQLQDDIDLVQFGFQRKDATKTPIEFHFKHQFADSTCRFFCSIYFAEQFRLLRKRIFADGEEKYIRSLQHSVAWGARGGKSGSAFFKSFDDRFVMKQMSKQELQCFLEFAPHYFRYVNKALDEQRPTLLAKILGIYRIGFKNPQSSLRQDVLVMENLFYDRKIDKTFDLKGSMRSRYVQTSEMKNDVLLDENLLEMIRESPIFFRPHSKAILSRAIHNDTEFLAQQMVMDYSLLVGIDEARSELIIGIIDFIRTFTWDKKLEMYVKASGILGGQGRMPTVVSPELYRTRFTEAMKRYFLMVPDKWTGLGSDLD